MVTDESNERTVSERRREQNRRAQRKFRERHGKRAYERRAPTPASSGSTAGAEFSDCNSPVGVVSGSIIASADPTTKLNHGMAFLPTRDLLSDLLEFSDNDCLASPEFSADNFLSTPAPEPPVDILQPIGTLAEKLPPESTVTGVPVPQIPIHMAVRQSSAKIVDLLLKHGADCNEPDDAGLSPLMSACIRGDIEIVNTLLDAGAAISCTDAHQQSPLHWAVLHRCEVLLKSLLKHCKGDSRVINAFDQDGHTPLHISIQTGFDTAVEALLRAGANAHCPVRK